MPFHIVIAWYLILVWWSITFPYQRLKEYLEVIIEVTRFERIWEEIRFRTLKELALNERKNIFFLWNNKEAGSKEWQEKLECKDSRQ